MGVHRCLREKKKVGGVGVHHVDQIGQGGIIGACFLGVNSEETYDLPRTGRASVRLADGSRSDWGVVEISVALLEI